jgi:rare lipoprotein A (peptidoglycan hydrolase)
MTARKSRYVAPPLRQPVALAASRPSVFVVPTIMLVVGGLAFTALVASLKSPAPAISTPAALDPADQSVNVASKGSRLEIASVAAGYIEPTMVKVVTFTQDAAEPTSAAVSGKPIYGVVSYYSSGRQTASGEPFDAHELTAAHRTLPFGTRVRVTSVDTGRSVTVRINDRGPFVRGRTLDVSRAAAQSLGIIDRGVGKVKLDVLQ